ncbi:MAG: enhanced serine sensitivity protein SseB C-terminal domain-containing protein [Clostridiales bacterium]|jgi:hypothetical protein|nr:enhanced serine sensitivity protein SseB C-terminal domain-containing protein [Clostridiales bacterium]
MGDDKTNGNEMDSDKMGGGEMGGYKMGYGETGGEADFYAALAGYRDDSGLESERRLYGALKALKLYVPLEAAPLPLGTALLRAAPLGAAAGRKRFVTARKNGNEEYVPAFTSLREYDKMPVLRAAGTGAGSAAGPSAGANTGADSGASNGYNAGANTGASAGTSTGIGAGADSGADASPSVDAGASTGASSNARAGAGPNAGITPSAGANAASGPNAGTSESASAGRAKYAAEYALLSFDTLKHMLLDDGRKIEGIVVNPHGQAALFPLEAIMRADSVTSGMSVQKTDGVMGEMYLGAPKSYPAGLAPALRKFLGGRPEVRRVSLYRAKRKMADRAHWLFLVFFAGRKIDLFPELAKLIQRFMKPGEVFELVQGTEGMVETQKAERSAIYEK